MTLFKLLSLLTLLCGATASSLKARESAFNPLDVRQVEGNQCANIEVSLLDYGIDADIITCLCLSDVPSFIDADPDASAAVATLGATELTDILNSYITFAATFNDCVYPENASPACIGENPCGFLCSDGLIPYPPGNPTSCVCPAPSVLCNGQCVAAGLCPSGAPSKKKRWLGSGICAEMGPEWAACGVFGGGARSWECINTARDLESCGGCMLPLTPYTPIGEDCSSLPGVADVACIAGECVVHRCLPGYVRAHDETHCVSEHGKISQPSEDENEVESIPAMVYRLEHVPLQKL